MCIRLLPTMQFIPEIAYLVIYEKLYITLKFNIYNYIDKNSLIILSLQF